MGGTFSDPNPMALLPSGEGRTWERWCSLFGALIDDWPLEATCPLLCATSGRKAGRTPTRIWPGFSITTDGVQRRATKNCQ